MKITLLGHEDIASLVALDRLKRLLSKHEFSVFLSRPDDTAPAAEGQLATLASVDRQLCRRFLAQHDADGTLRSAPTLNAPNTAQGLDTLHSTSPDLIVSIRYRRILKDAAIAVPACGVLNLHSGILPDYRGVMATFWAMLCGEAEIGCTLHRIVDSGIDTGPVLAIHRRPVHYDQSYLRNVLALYGDGCRLISEAVTDLDSGREPPVQTQPADEGRYFSTPDRDALQAFERKGLKLADGNEFVALQQ